MSLGQVLDAIPFGNLLAVAELSGSDLRAALEHGLGLLGRGGFPQVAGLRFTWDAARPAGDRIVLLEAGSEAQGWAPVEPARTYRIATNDFLRRGGDGYAVLRDRADAAYDNGPLVSDVVADALGGLAGTGPGSTGPRVEGRITRR